MVARRFGIVDGRRLPMVEWRERIVVDPEVMTGKPIIKGTRLTVDHVIELLAEGWTTDQVIEEYPGVTTDDVGACLAYASELVKSEKVYPARVV
jgi:uncharacterized protein (DUF433 family)